MAPVARGHGRGGHRCAQCALLGWRVGWRALLRLSYALQATSNSFIAKVLLRNMQKAQSTKH
jgi:hypothetical protein